MLSNRNFTGVSVAGMSCTLPVAVAQAAHPAFWAYDAAGAAAAISPQRKRRHLTATTGTSVNRGFN